MCTKQTNLVGLARAVKVVFFVEALDTTNKWWVGNARSLQLEFLDGLVNGLFSHLSVSGPLATGHGKKSRFRGGEQVVSDKTFRLGLLRVADKRTDTRPGGKNIAAANVDLWLQVVLHFLQDPLDLLLLCDWVGLDIAGRISRTGNGVSLPWQEENHTAVRGARVDQTHVGRRVVARQDNVDSRARRDNFRHLLLVHLADRVGERSSSVDDSLGLDAEFLALLAVLLWNEVLDLGTTEAAIGIFLEASDFHVVHQSSTVEGSSHCERDVHSRVIVCTIVVDESTPEVVLLQHRESVQCLTLGQEVRSLDVLRASQKVVELGSCPEVRRLPPLVDRNHDREPLREMRCGVEEVSPLTQSFLDEFVLVVVQFEDSLFEISHTTVNELCALTTCARCKVVSFNHGDLQTS